MEALYIIFLFWKTINRWSYDLSTS